MDLSDQIQKDLDQALKSKKEAEVSTLRMLKSAIKNASIAKKEDLDETEITKIIRSEIKKRKESIEAFTQGDRSDLAEKEKKEIEVLKIYLPQELSDEQIRSWVWL